ncbi:hypothetical protein ACET3Z_002135 [Daucus carota]
MLHSLGDIKSATNNFKEEMVIGKGGFGIVYKGLIDSKERIVAIKRAKSMSKQGSKEFLTEIEMLSKSQHSHVVSLVGYCDDDDQMILVYEYMPSGTLADHLYKRVRKGETSLPSLTWVQRLKICIGTAHGLNYLHTGTNIETRVIHRDVKTSNILLNENFAAKISDFGLSKTGPANQTCTYVSTRVKGTPGYLDPYYVETRRLTRKSDVYAFGVVLFEVLCGRPAVDRSLDEEQIGLAGWVQHCFKEGHLDQIIDPNVKASISSDSLNAYVDVAIKCLDIRPKLRPTMAEIVVGLESALTLQEKSTHYTLPEIIPDDFTQEDLKLSKPEVVSTIRNPKLCTGEGNKKSCDGMTFPKRVSAFVSLTARVFSGNRNAKRSRYSFSVLSVNSHKVQAAGSQTFIPVYQPEPPTPRREEEALKSPKYKIFTFNDLAVATRKFYPDSLLGEGGFGRVYKGWIDENTLAATKWGTGLAIAVKRLNVEGFQGCAEWMTEINHLDTLCHPNIIKLIGYCSEEEHRLLVYEFMPQGSVEKLLFRRDSNFKPLTWKLRMSIALGAAKGLAYLHSSEARVIYRDLKASNILIDSNYNAKISDFGLATNGPDAGESHVSTRVMGTYGYAAPEYITTGHLYLKSDVFSFGVLLLELLAGRRVIDLTLPTTEHNLVDWAKPCLTSKRKILHVIDASMEGQYTVGAALAASLLALQCLSEDHNLRPDANQVVKALEQLQEFVNSG